MLHHHRYGLGCFFGYSLVTSTIVKSLKKFAQKTSNNEKRLLEGGGARFNNQATQDDLSQHEQTLERNKMPKNEG